MTGATAPARALTGRDRAILRAVATGRAELATGAMPVLLLGGRFCCDQHAAVHLVRAALIAPARTCAAGQRVTAVVTAAGRGQLADASGSRS